MREAAFIKINGSRWKEFENLAASKTADPDKLAELYIELNDDLAYAQSNYPESNVIPYLNSLTGRIHNEIYKNKKEKKSRFITFWKLELPDLFYVHRKYFFYSFLVFGISTLIGSISAAKDADFVRLILGDGYVNMTLENIENGDPMAVYKDDNMMGMFLAITVNNVRVAFITFAFGLLTSLGTGFILFRNGVMLGAFQYFFHTKNLLLTSALTIWIHGTIEISSIIIAGAAGMIMGNSLLFPGTYSRLESFKKGARTGIKIVIGLVPFFIIAGFLEGFVTRLTEMPDAGKMLIIFTSAAIIIFYFIIYPWLLNRKSKTGTLAVATQQVQN